MEPEPQNRARLEIRASALKWLPCINNKPHKPHYTWPIYKLVLPLHMADLQTGTTITHGPSTNWYYHYTWPIYKLVLPLHMADLQTGTTITHGRSTN